MSRKSLFWPQQQSRPDPRTFREELEAPKAVYSLPVDVVYCREREIVVDDSVHIEEVDAASHEVRADKNMRGSLSEFVHNSRACCRSLLC